MALILSLAISVLALLATFHQSYMQRVHNQKSVKPLVQINFTDNGNLIYVHVRNNGIGPLIIEKLTFVKDTQAYHTIKDCLTLSPTDYQHVSVNESLTRVVPPATSFEVFSKTFEGNAIGSEMADVRHQLAPLKLKVEGKDIYDNKIVVERDLSWFLRHHSA